MVEKGKKGSIRIDRERCKGCYLCVSVCPNQVIIISDKLNQQGYYPAEFMGNNNTDKRCVACATCATMCPDVAIEVYRE